MGFQSPSLYESRKRITKELKVNQRKPVMFGLTQQFKDEFGVVPVVWRNPFE